MTKMEPTFYHEDNNVSNRDRLSDDISLMKKNMSLDFAQSQTGAGMKRKYANILQSPDLHLLKLASPELERMIIQANGGMFTTTPTPTQLIFPNLVTEEQEAYARGFVDALNELHHQKSTPEKPQYTTLTTATPTTGTISNLSHSVPVHQSRVIHSGASAVPVSTLQTTHPIVSRNMKFVNTPKLTQILDVPRSTLQTNFAGATSLLSLVKEEPQTVPCMGTTPPLSPINMDAQEQIKIERKRARNRVAARKCRTRKLERISRLEDHVGHLKSRNMDLEQSASNLREQVYKLKQQIMDHVSNGCQVIVNDGASSFS